MLAALPVAIVVALAWASAWVEHGSILGRDWLQYAVLVALVAAAVIARGASVPTRATLVGAGALLALAAWKGASVAWSPDPADARTDDLLTALYAIVLVLPGLSSLGRNARIVAVGVVGLASAVMAVAAGVELATTSTVDAVVRDGQLAFPVSYVNAQASLFVMGFWPAVVVAGLREAAVPVRALAYSAAAATGCGFVLTQSKGAAIGLFLSAVVVFAVYPRRLRLLPPCLVAVVAAAAGFTRLTAPYQTPGIAVVHTAGETLVVAAAAAALAGWAVAWADDRWPLPPAVTRVLGRGLLVALAAAVIAAVALFFAREHHPVAFAQARWHSFERLPAHDTATSHFTSLGSNRVDFWRVAVHEFERKPLTGIGSWGFGPAYLQLGRSFETPARAHSLFLETLAENGIVGLLLLVVALGVPLAAVAARARGPAAAAALAGCVCFLTQAAVDWTWTFPAAAIPFFVLLGVGAADSGRRPLVRREAVPAAAALILLALVGFGPPLASARLTTNALAHPGSRNADLRWARWLDPLSTDPEVAAYELGEGIAPIEHAARMAPDDFAFPLLLGEVYLSRHEYAAARAELERARALYPRSALIARELRLSERRSR